MFSYIKIFRVESDLPSDKALAVSVASGAFQILNYQMH